MQKTEIWRKDSEWNNHKDLDRVIEDLIRKDNTINCIVPIEYNASVQMSTSIKEALIIYTPHEN